MSQSQEDLVSEMTAAGESMPAVKHYEQKEFSGMFEYNKDDELIIMKKLILGWLLHSFILYFFINCRT